MPDNVVPDIYFDRFNIVVDAMGVTVDMGRSIPPHDGVAPKNLTAGLFRTSLENWKVLLMTGRKQLKAHEQEHNIKIQLPKPLLDSLGLSEGEW